jgi:4-amino-4-deoxy-L-arabinose transferase-like glycosyltransferase
MVILGFAVRIFNLEITGLWMDELHSVIGSDPGKTLANVIEYCKKDQPPLFFLILYGWFKLFSYNDFNGHLLVAIIGSLSIVAIYFTGREWKNQAVGVAAAFLTSINYFHVDASRQIRFYPLVFLLSSLSYLFFLRIVKKRKAHDFIFYIVSTSALLNTHYFGLVVFGSQFLIFIILIFWKKITDRRFLALSFLSGITVALSFAHWIPVIISDLGISEFHAQELTWYFPAIFHWVYFRDIITAAICAILGVLAIREVFLSVLRRQTTEAQVILLGWIGFGFLIPLLYSWIRMPMLEYKYTFIVLPAIFILIAIGLESLKVTKLKVYIVLILFLSFHINAIFIKPIYYAKPLEQWREVTREVMKTDNPNQVVFAQYAWYYRYYFNIYKSFNQPLEPKYADFREWINSSKSVWVLISTRFPDEGLSMDQETMLEQDFKLEKDIRFKDAEAKYYVRR